MVKNYYQSIGYSLIKDGMWRKKGTDYVIVDSGGMFDVVGYSTLSPKKNVVMRTRWYDSFGSIESAMRYVDEMTSKRK